MKKIVLFPIVFWIVATSKMISQTVPSITIDTILHEKISIRAMVIDTDRLWYAGNDNQLGYYNFKTGQNVAKRVESPGLKMEFRSLAQNSKSIFLANIGNPAHIFRVDKSNWNMEKVYTETHEKVFYDSMQFWNDTEGITIGDPTEDCLSILLTRDGGATWAKLPCESLPKVVEGEAAFAASNTNICVKGHKVWVVSGGAKSRVFYSGDKGRHWTVTTTPIVQGKAMTGIFTADFYDEKMGIVAGGNYEEPEQNFQNKAITSDGGKTWKLIGEHTGFGYASCIQFMPKSKGKRLLVVGALGMHYSDDGGVSWSKLSDDKTLFTIRFLNEDCAFVAGKNKILKITFKK